MNKKLFSFLKYILLLGIGVGLLYLAFRGVDVKKTFDEIAGAKAGWLLASVSVSLIAFTSRAYRWNLLIEPLGYKPRLSSTLYSLMIGYLANLAIPRLGEVSRCGSLSEAEKLPFNKLLGTVIVERIIDVISLLICLLITAFIEYERLGKFLIDSVITPIMSKITPVTITIAVVGILILAGAVIWTLKKKKESGESKIATMIKGLIDGLSSIGQLKRPIAFIFHSILLWVMYFLMAYLAFFCLPATAGLDSSAGLFVLVIGGLGMAAPVQGGIGAYHLLVSQGLMLFGLSQQDGLAFATLLHTSQLLVIIICGAASFLLLFLAKKNKAHELAGENPV